MSDRQRSRAPWLEVFMTKNEFGTRVISRELNKQFDSVFTTFTSAYKN